MAKLTTEKKLEILKPFVEKLFLEGNTDVEDIAGLAFMGGATKDTGIKMQELTPLARTYGIDNGYIKTIEQRRDAARDEAKSDDLESLTTYPLLIEYCENLADTHELPEKWVISTVSSIMSSLDLYVPEKSTLTEWQKATVKAFRNNPNLTAKELDDIISNCDIQNFNHYTKLVHGLCNAIANHEIVVD